MIANKVLERRSVDLDKFIPDIFNKVDKTYYSIFYLFTFSNEKWITIGSVSKNDKLHNIAKRLNDLTTKELNELIILIKSRLRLIYAK